MATQLSFCKRRIDPDRVELRPLGEMSPKASSSEMAAQLSSAGYLFLRGLIPREEVLAARRELLQKYAILGEVDDRYEIDLGLAGDRSYRSAVNVRAFRRSLVGGYHYQRVSRHPALFAVVERLLPAPVRMLDYLWPRMLPPGSGCGLHQDAPYLRGPSETDILSVWTPLGDIRREEGALLLLEGSHESALLREEYGNRDIDRTPDLGWYSTDLESTGERLGGTWVSTDFRAGDVLLFSIYTLHGALDNHSAEGRVRLSSDSRFQSERTPAHPRWIGPDPVGRASNLVFLPRPVEAEDALNRGLGSEFHRVDDLGRIVS